MIRQIIKIDEQKCNGCGKCVAACHESALKIIDGKARLIRDDYCDGMGDCLPNCPKDAIKFEMREALKYDESAVEENKKKAAVITKSSLKQILIPRIDDTKSSFEEGSQLTNWPLQLKLAPLKAPYFDSAELLIAADCSAYTYANFHNDFIKGRVVLIACPKLDNIDYSEKLYEIILSNSINSITLVRMEVPCCKGLEIAIAKAITKSLKNIPFKTIVISKDGHIISE